MYHSTPTAIALGYSALIVLLALASTFSETSARRDAAYRALRIVAPWGAVAIAAELVFRYHIAGM
jgi:hypothetical protein